MSMPILPAGMAHIQFDLTGKAVEDFLNKYLLTVDYRIPEPADELQKPADEPQTFTHILAVREVRFSKKSSNNSILFHFELYHIELANMALSQLPMVKAIVPFKVQGNTISILKNEVEVIDGEETYWNGGLKDKVFALDGFRFPDSILGGECNFLAKATSNNSLLLCIGFNNPLISSSTYSVDDFYNKNPGLLNTNSTESFSFSIHTNIINFLLKFFIEKYNNNPSIKEITSIDSDTSIIISRGGPDVFIVYTGGRFSIEEEDAQGVFSAEVTLEPKSIYDPKYVHSDKYALGGDYAILCLEFDVDSVWIDLLEVIARSLILPILGPDGLDAILSQIAKGVVGDYLNYSEDVFTIDNEKESFLIRLAQLSGIGYLYPLFFSSNKGVFIHPEYTMLVGKGITSDDNYIINIVDMFKPWSPTSILSPNLSFDVHSPHALSEMGNHYPDKKYATINNTNDFPIAILGWKKVNDESSKFSNCFIVSSSSVPLIIMPKSKINIEVEFNGTVYDKTEGQYCPANSYPKGTTFEETLEVQILFFDFQKGYKIANTKSIQIEATVGGIDQAYNDFLQNKYFALYEKALNYSAIKAYYGILGYFQQSAEILEDIKPQGEPIPGTMVSVNIYSNDPGLHSFEVVGANQVPIAVGGNSSSMPYLSVLVSPNTPCFIKAVPKPGIKGNFVFVSKDNMIPDTSIDFKQPISEFIPYKNSLIVISKGTVRIYQLLEKNNTKTTLEHKFDDDIVGIRKIDMPNNKDKFVLFTKNHLAIISNNEIGFNLRRYSLKNTSNKAIKAVEVLSFGKMAFLTRQDSFEAVINEVTQTVTFGKKLEISQLARINPTYMSTPVCFIKNKVHALKRNGSLSFLLSSNKKNIMMFRVIPQSINRKYFNIPN